MTILQGEIFYSQKYNLFNSSPSEELKAAYREAVTTVDGGTTLDIAQAAATKEVLEKAEQVRQLNKDNKDREAIVNAFLIDAHKLKLFLRND